MQSILSGTAVTVPARKQQDAPDLRETAGLIAQLESERKAAEDRAIRAEDALAVERQTKLDGLCAVLDAFSADQRARQAAFHDLMLEAADRAKPDPVVFPPDNSGAVLEAISGLAKIVGAITIPAPAPQVGQPPARQWSFDIRRDELGNMKNITAKPQTIQ